MKSIRFVKSAQINKYQIQQIQQGADHKIHKNLTLKIV